MIQMEYALGDFAITYESKMMERVHRVYQDIALSGGVSDLEIIKYLNTVPCRVPLDYKLG